MEKPATKRVTKRVVPQQKTTVPEVVDNRRSRSKAETTFERSVVWDDDTPPNPRGRNAEQAALEAIRRAQKSAREALSSISAAKEVKLPENVGRAVRESQNQVRDAMKAMHDRLAAGGVLYLGVTQPVLPKTNWDDLLPQVVVENDEAAASLLLIKGATADRVLAATPAGPSPMEDAVGPFYDTAGLTKWLGVTRQALDGRVRTLTLLACTTGSGQRVYPSWQFDADGNTIPELSSVLRALATGIDDPWTWALWLSAPTLEDPETGDDEISAWQWLIRGYDPEPVLFEARADSARWAS